MQELFESVLRKLTKKLDPVLEKYRDKKPEVVAKRYSEPPKTEAELLDVLRKAPESVLSKKQRKLVASAMAFPATKAEEIMLEKPAVTFVKETEFLGPLTLDKLYKSGFTCFPVVDGSGKIVGTLTIDNLTSLAIKSPEPAIKYLDPNIYYVRADYTLEDVFAAFLRTNANILIVINKRNEVVGIITLEMLVSFLLGKSPRDNFNKDSDRLAVLHRFVDE